MRVRSILPWVTCVAMFGGEPGHASESGTAESEEYVSSAKQEVVSQGQLKAFPDLDGHVLRVELPPGWVGDWHYHTGDVFVYVLDGEFVVDVEGEERKSFGAGEVYHEAINTVMQARNGSSENGARLILFQVGERGAPRMIKAKNPKENPEPGGE